MLPIPVFPFIGDSGDVILAVQSLNPSVLAITFQRDVAWRDFWFACRALNAVALGSQRTMKSTTIKADYSSTRSSCPQREREHCEFELLRQKFSKKQDPVKLIHYAEHGEMESKTVSICEKYAKDVNLLALLIWHRCRSGPMVRSLPWIGQWLTKRHASIHRLLDLT